MSFTLLPVVEGQADVKAAPILLRRICAEEFGRWDVQVREPWRLPRSKMVIPAEVGRVYQPLSKGAADGAGAVVVVLDQDDDAAVHTLATAVAAPMQARAPIEVVVACREYEAWFLGGIESLRHHHSVRDDAQFPGNPEAPRNAKGALERQMNESYRETLHQPAFSTSLSIGDTRRRCPSFDYLVHAVGRLLSFAPPA